MSELLPVEQGFIERARKDLIRGSLWTLAATITAAPVALAVSVALARGLGVRELGRLATAMAIFTVAGALTNLGWSEATVQWLSSATARGDEDERMTVIRRCAGFHTFISGPMQAAIAFFILSPGGFGVAVAGAAVVWIINVFGTSSIVLTAGARNAMSAQISLAAGTMTQGSVACSALLFHRYPQVLAVTWFSGLAVPLLTLSKLTSRERRAVWTPRLDLRPPAGFWTYALSAALSGLAGMLVFGRSEIFALRADGLVAASGIFTVLTGLSSQMTGPFDSVLAPLLPIAAGIHAIDPPQAREVFWRSLRVASMLGSLAVITCVPIGSVLLAPLYGARFGGSAAGFIALGIVSCVQTMVGPLTAFAFATRSALGLLRINVMSIAIDAAVAFGLVPFVGLAGAVAANVSAQLLGLLLMANLVSKRLGVPRREIGRSLRLFPVACLLALGEAVLDLALHGWFRLLTAPTVLIALIVFRQLLVSLPGLGLTGADALLIIRGVGRREALVRRALTLLGAPTTRAPGADNRVG